MIISLQKTNRFLFYTIIFLADAISMILELIASRVMNPFFGSTQYVWTAIIGIILLSGSIGNYIGGKLADKYDNRKLVTAILALASIFTISIPAMKDSVLPVVSSAMTDIRIGATISTIILFFIPSLLIGLLTPIIIKLTIENEENIGEISGQVHAAMTVGGLVGTFVGGFFLIPHFGVNLLLYGVGVALLVTMFISMIGTVLSKRLVAGFVLLGILLGILAWFLVPKDQTMSNEIGEELVFETKYNHCTIRNALWDDEPVRLFITSPFSTSSAMYLDESKQYDLVFGYTDAYNMAYNARKTDESLRTLMIGGCGYSYPKYYISHYPDDSIDVVEIDGEITELAKQYFGLEQFIKEIRTEETGRMDLITEDGRTFLNRQDQKYDLIFNDAFSGGTPVPTLASIEGCQRIKQNLNDGGIYACNIIGSLTGENSRFARAEINTISHVFRNIAVVDVSPDREASEIRNFVVFASDGDLSGIPGNYIAREDNDDISSYNNMVLRDDYCPAEYLTINA